MRNKNSDFDDRVVEWRNIGENIGDDRGRMTIDLSERMGDYRGCRMAQTEGAAIADADAESVDAAIVSARYATDVPSVANNSRGAKA